MDKIKNPSNKKRYDRYKQENRRGLNKAKKAERHKKRMEKFAARREAGKAYSYTPNPYKKGTDKYEKEKRKRQRKNVDHKTPTQQWDSIYGKLCKYLDKRQAEARKAAKNDERAQK